MKKIALFCLSLLVVATTGFAKDLLVENQISYTVKDQKSKIAIQWASSAKEVDEENKAIMQGSKLNPNTMKTLTQPGKITVKVPEKAEYFRVLVWSKGQEEPDLLTNWVDIVPGKTYQLTAEHLVPAVLMSGSGC